MAIRIPKKTDEGRMADEISLIRTALEVGNTTKQQISEATGIKINRINLIFSRNKDIYNLYVVYRRTMVDVAENNLDRILRDKSHPQNYQATQYVLKNYKSDLDEILEDKEGENISVNIGGKSTASPVTIKFGNKK